MTKTTQLSCNCGKVRLEIENAPILSSECHCNSCRAAAARLQSRYPTLHMIEPNGGTQFVLYRKDRVRFVEGFDLLKEFRLGQSSKTRRVVATCCYTPVFLEFESGHWLSLYASMWPKGKSPLPEERTMTSDLPDRSLLPSDIPNSKHQSIKFFAKLLGAWIAMGFRSPKITIVGGTLES